MMKTLFWYVFFFFLMYYEQVRIGGVPLSQLWKIPLLCYVFFYVIRHRVKHLQFIKYAYSYGIVKLFNKGLFYHFPIVISDFSRFMTFPLLFDYVTLKVKKSERILSSLFHISQFTILSFIPFLLKIIDSPKYVNDRSTRIEIMEEAGRTSGLFGSSHAASAMLALCLIYIIYRVLNYSQSRKEKIHMSFLLVIGLWALIYTYARGGWVMFIVGLVCVFIRRSTKYLLWGSFISVFLFLGVNYLMQNNEYFYNRLTDRNEQGVQNKKERIGSGRLWFAMNGVNFWLNESNNLNEYVAGQGVTAVMEYQESKTGLYIYCHNGYVDALAQNGLLGFICCIGMSFYMFQYVVRNKRSPYRRFCVTIVIMYITFQLLQGGANPYSDLFYVFALQLSRIGEQESQNMILW